MMDTARLAKILTLLSSDQPGEVVAAAAAIGRVLREGSVDWHWLSGRLLNGGGPSMGSDLGEVRRLNQLVGSMTIENRRLRDELAVAIQRGAMSNLSLREVRREVESLRGQVASLKRVIDAAARGHGDAPAGGAGPRVRAKVNPSGAAGANWRFRAQNLLAHDTRLNAMAREFLEGVLRRDRRLSERQAKWLDDLWSGYRRWRAERAAQAASRDEPLREALDDEVPF